MKEEIKLSKYQENGVNYFVNGNGNMYFDAAAGSGKTFIITHLATLVSPGLRSIFVAFNKHIVTALAGRLPSNIPTKTMNSLGNTCLMKHKGQGRSRLDQYKYQNKSRDVIAARFSQLDYKEKKELSSVLANIVRMSMCTLTDYNSVTELSIMAAKYGFEVKDEVIYSLVPEIIQWGIDMFNEQYLIDYTDQLWLPFILGLNSDKYDFIMVDEAQDLNRLQHMMLQRASHKNTRVVFVGDPKQCQPPETMVTMRYGPKKPIESIYVGDEVLSFVPRDGMYQSGKVEGISVTPYDGEMVDVYWKRHKTSCTYNHKFVVRWDKNAYEKQIVYLMKKGNSYRIGKTQLFLNGNVGFGLGSRCRIEKADCAWILGLYDNVQEALYYEQLLSSRFGLPQITFQEGIYGMNHKYQILVSQDFIESLYNELGNLTEKAIAVLKSVGQYIDCPIYTRGNLPKLGKTTSFEIYACNLIAGYMSIPDNTVISDVNTNRHFGPRFPEYLPIKMISRSHYKGKVYGLQINKGTYIADSIPTHNSMYGFTGAMTDGLAQLKATLNAEQFALPICYRCPKTHIRIAQYFDSGRTKPKDDAIEGEVNFILQAEIFSKVALGDLVLCRLTAPLIGVCIKLIAKHISAKVLGKEIGRSLITLVDGAMSESDGERPDWNEFPGRLRGHVDEIRGKLSRQANTEPQIELLNDKMDCIETCYTSTEFDTSSQSAFTRKIESMFSDDESSITLCTVHKAKGLEADNVFIIADKNSRDCIPLIRQKQQQWEMDQEINIGYVATTRAKKALTFCSTTLKDQERHKQFFLLGGISKFIRKAAEVSVTEPPKMPQILQAAEEKQEPKRFLNEDDEEISVTPKKKKQHTPQHKKTDYTQTEMFPKPRQPKIKRIII